MALDLGLDHRNNNNRITCSTTVVVDMRALLIHPLHPHHLLLDTVVVVVRLHTMIRTMGQDTNTTIAMHTNVPCTMTGQEDAIGVGVIERNPIIVMVDVNVDVNVNVNVMLIEGIIVMHRIRRRDRFEVEIESERVLPVVGCCSTRTRRNITIIITTIGGTETKTVILLLSIIILLLLLLLEVEIEARVVAEGAVPGVTVEMEDGVGECARIAENEIIEDPAGGVGETSSIETTRDTRVSREPKSLDLADGIAMKIT